ncbi:hypothetical protein HDU93_003903, partial [Gonapodya sp. JEL0774]
TEVELEQLLGRRLRREVTLSATKAKAATHSSTARIFSRTPDVHVLSRPSRLTADSLDGLQGLRLAAHKVCVVFGYVRYESRATAAIALVRLARLIRARGVVEMSIISGWPVFVAAAEMAQVTFSPVSVVRIHSKGCPNPIEEFFPWIIKIFPDVTFMTCGDGGVNQRKFTKFLEDKESRRRDQQT